MSETTEQTKLLSGEAQSLVLKYRGNPEKLSTWGKAARALNQRGFRTTQGKRFTAPTLTRYAKSDGLAANFGIKAEGWTRTTRTKKVPRRTQPDAVATWEYNSHDTTDTKLSDITEILGGTFSDSFKLRMITTVVSR